MAFPNQILNSFTKLSGAIALVFLFIILFFVLLVIIHEDGKPLKEIKDLKEGDFWVDEYNPGSLQNALVYDSMLFCNTIKILEGQNYLYCLSLQTGKVNWRYPVDDYATQPIEIYKNEIYFSTYTGDISKLTMTGDLIWEQKFKPSYAGHKVNPYNGNLIVNSVVQGTFELDKETGEVIFEYNWSYGGICHASLPLFYENKLIFANAYIDSTSNKEYLIAINNDTKELEWKYEQQNTIEEFGRSAPILFENYLVFIDNQKSLTCLNTNNGVMIWNKSNLSSKEYWQYPFNIMLHKDSLLCNIYGTYMAFDIRTGEEIDFKYPVDYLSYVINYNENNYLINVSYDFASIDADIAILRF